jgi:hypothetical protein
MKTELIIQSAKIFESETVDKWNAFIELCFARREIRTYYFMKFRTSILKHFSLDVIQPWEFTIINEEEYRWFIKDFRQDSIALRWDVNRFSLWCNPNNVKVELLNDLLRTPEYMPILGCIDFDSIGLGGQKEYLISESHKFVIDEIEFKQRVDDEKGHLELSWYAGNRTDELVKIIDEKVNKFRTPEITKLIIELNNLCKK